MQTAILEIIGQLGIMIALIVLGRLSARLGSATKAKKQHIGFYIAAAIMFVSIIIRVLNIVYEFVSSENIQDSLLWVLFYDGLPALAITLGILFAWHYWSWLLAERD
jgi:hypothetical protein